MSREQGAMSTDKKTAHAAPATASPETRSGQEQTLSAARSAILVLGMHRSGTSAFARVLNLLGAALPQNLMPPKEDNPKGFWESMDLEAIHNELLQAAGSHWSDWRPLDQQWLSSAEAAAYKRRLVEHLGKDFAQSRLCAVKDPRICRFVPLWLDALRDSGIEPLPLLPLRNPLEVVTSLRRRNGLSPSAGYLLWLRHVLEAERSTRGMRRCIVSFDDLLENWESAMTRVAQRLQVGWPTGPAQAKPEIDRFLDRRFRNHWANMPDLDGDPLAPDWVKLAYRALRQMTGPEERPEDQRTLDRIFREFDTASVAFGYSAPALAALEEVAQGLRRSLEQDGEALRELRLELQESQSKAQTLTQELAAGTQKQEEYRSELKRRDETIRRLLKETEQRRETEAKNASHIHHVETRLHGEVHRNQAVLHELHLEKQISYSYQILVDKLYLTALARQRQDAPRNLRPRLSPAAENNAGGGVAESGEQAHRYGQGSWRSKLADAGIRAIDRLLFRGDPLLAFHCLSDASDEAASRAWATEPAACRRAKDPASALRPAAEEMFGSATSKACYTKQRKKELETFLLGRHDLHFPPLSEPLVSVVLVLFNRAELTYACLRSIIECTRVAVELVVVNNDSSDETSDLLRKVHNIRLIANDTNRGFVDACNQAAKVARGRYILFLNNDAELFPQTLEAALAVYDEEPDVGAVGGKILLLDGRLQEAGSIVWQDGSCLGYGRGDFAFRPEYMFRREVDYCSGAFLLVPSALFRKLGGFDEDFAPGYYEETDFCMRVRAAGFRVLYEPRAIIRHFEFASTEGREQAVRLQERNKEIFKQKHPQALAAQLPPALGNIRRARFARKQIKSVLYIDDRVPLTRLGGGFPRSNQIVRSLCESGCAVTVYPLNFPLESTWDEIYQEIPVQAEVVIGEGRGHFGYFLEQRIGCYDVVFVSRPHNMEFVNQIFTTRPDLLGDARLVYDSEAIAAFREKSQAELADAGADSASYAVKVREELSLARNADRILVVSPQERDVYVHHGYRNVSVLGHALAIQATETTFADRKDFLFVGNLDSDGSPNVDSLQWFVAEVLPRIRRILGEQAPALQVVGSNRAPALNRLAGPDVVFQGAVPDLREWYASARVFIAPTRFAAGIPHKIHEAAANGLPVVATDILIAQLRWQEGVELMGAGRDDPELFARKCAELYQSKDLWERVRHFALFRVGKECSREQFNKQLQEGCGLLPVDNHQHADSVTVRGL